MMILLMRRRLVDSGVAEAAVLLIKWTTISIRYNFSINWMRCATEVDYNECSWVLLCQCVTPHIIHVVVVVVVTVLISIIVFFLHHIRLAFSVVDANSPLTCVLWVIRCHRNDRINSSCCCLFIFLHFCVSLIRWLYYWHSGGPDCLLLILGPVIMSLISSICVSRVEWRANHVVVDDDDDAVAALLSTSSSSS